MGNNNVKDYPPYLDYPKPRKPITNADRIRAMTDEELSIFLANLAACPECNARREDCGTNCWETWLDWLKQEAT